MHSFIMKVTHSIPAKDTIAVVRGLYKVVEGGINVSRNQNISQNSNTSWHNNKVSEVKSSDLTEQKVKMIKKDTINKAQTELVKDQQIKLKSDQFEHKQNIIKINQNLNKINAQTIQTKNNKNHDYKQFIKDIQSADFDNKNNYQAVQSKLPSSRFSRFFQFGKLGLNIAQSAVQAYFTNDKDPSKQQEVYQKIANKISDELCKMRGAPLKLAQMLSIQEDKLIPAPIRKAFEKARQTAHVLPQDEVIFMMKKNFGPEWKNHFVYFDEKPFASASIGQVHKGSLDKIGEVAIKIQYPGVRKSIESDISNLNFLMKIPGVFPKGMYMQRILKKTKQELTQQCDYILQKQKQQAYEQCLIQCLNKQTNLFKVPKVYEHLTTSQIFTSQYLNGVSMKKLEEDEYHQEIKDEVGRRIMLITFNEIFQMGIVQSDPNPANFTFNFKTDQLNLFDFGATHIYKKSFLEDYYKVIEGSVKQNKKQIIQASIKTGFLTGQQSQSMNDSHAESIQIVGQPLRHKGRYDFGNQKITQRIYKTIPYMLKNRLKHPPQEVYSLHRKLSGSYLACMRLKARVDCNKIWEEIKFQRIIQKIQRKQYSRLII